MMTATFDETKWKLVPVKATHSMAWEIMLAHRADGDDIRIAEDAWARAVRKAPAAPTAAIAEADAKDAARLDLIESVIGELGYFYLHANKPRFELVGLGVVAGGLRKALDELAERRAMSGTQQAQNSQQEGA